MVSTRFATAVLLALWVPGVSSAGSLGEVQNVTMDAVVISWDPVPGAVMYRVARGDVTALPNYCSSRVDLTPEIFTFDYDVPVPGGTYTYVIAAVDPSGEGTYGLHFSGTERRTFMQCDTDNDGLHDAIDNCPVDANAAQIDTDNDSLGDSCDFDAFGVTLRGRIALREFPGVQSIASDIWHYVSPAGEEYAMIGLWGGVAFARVTDPDNTAIVGFVHGEGIFTHVRDMAVFGDHAYLVSGSGGVGLQIVDLSQIDSNVVTRVNTTFLGIGFTESHNVFINQDSGYLYFAIPNTNGKLGITAVDLNVDPVNPTVAGTWTDTDPFVRCHDLQVVNYTSGPFVGKEIAFCFAENDGVRIVDVTDKLAMFRRSGIMYPNTAYCHQGWLSDDKQYLFVGDELDENNGAVPSTTTYVIDVADLDAPSNHSSFTNGSGAIDHNLMVRDDIVYEANYQSGLRVWAACNINNIQEIGYFDTYPEGDLAAFDGAWGVSAALPSGTIIVSDRQRGLFVLDPSIALDGFNNKCVTGPPLDPLCGDCVAQVCTLDSSCCSIMWDATCVVGVRTVCGSLSCSEAQGICSHGLCQTGPLLSASCDAPPAAFSCVDAICTAQPSCCSTTWDSSCVDAIVTVCGANCD